MFKKLIFNFLSPKRKLAFLEKHGECIGRTGLEHNQITVYFLEGYVVRIRHEGDKLKEIFTSRNVKSFGKSIGSYIAATMPRQEA
ncbi:MAG: hypothetical protein OEX02_01270 [Cyclobacteriaceae bacterium]|nr:hypothetical protein [Cyclobacteriaceae bacterium]